MPLGGKSVATIMLIGLKNYCPMPSVTYMILNRVHTCKFV